MHIYIYICINLLFFKRIHINRLNALLLLWQNLNTVSSLLSTTPREFPKYSVFKNFWSGVKFNRHSWNPSWEDCWMLPYIIAYTTDCAKDYWKPIRRTINEISIDVSPTNLTSCLVRNYIVSLVSGASLHEYMGWNNLFLYPRCSIVLKTKVSSALWKECPQKLPRRSSQSGPSSAWSNM